MTNANKELQVVNFIKRDNQTINPRMNRESKAKEFYRNLNTLLNSILQIPEENVKKKRE